MNAFIKVMYIYFIAAICILGGMIGHEALNKHEQFLQQSTRIHQLQDTIAMERARKVSGIQINDIMNLKNEPKD